MKGRKRFVVVDTLGLPILFRIVPASVQESDGGPPAIGEAKNRSPCLSLVWADSGYNDKCVQTVREKYGITLEIVTRPDQGDKRRWTLPGAEPQPVDRGFRLLPHRWVVERTFAWILNNRRLVRDYEATIASSLGWLFIAFIRLLAQRLGMVAA